MKIFFIAAILLLLAIPVISQSRIKLEGKVIDKETKFPIVGANIYSVKHSNRGAISDEAGGYSLTLTAGKHTIICSFIGYKTIEKIIDLTQSLKLDFILEEDRQTMEEVTILSKSTAEKFTNSQIGVERIEITEMAKMPSLFGERDIIKSMQLLPGIKSEGDGTSGYQVRGGTSAQNLILLDDATIYNSGHLMGLFSTFNDDALTNASLYKGQIPAQFGGATSSVFDINTKSGDMEKFKINGSIGILSAKLNMEGPIAKDKASFFIAARRSYLDLFLKLDKEYKNNTLNFYDLNAKVNYNPSKNNKIFFSFFSGKDNMGLDDLMDMKWGNLSGTLRWFHQFNDKLYSNTSIILSSYSADMGMEILEMHNSFDSYINHSSIKESIEWLPNVQHDIKFGFQTTFLNLKSAEWNLNNYEEKEKRKAWENSLWINEDWKITDFISLSGGLRFNLFSALGGSPYYKINGDGDITEILNYKSGEIVKTHFTLEPRFSINYRIQNRHSIKTGYSRTSQNVHAVRVGSMSMPFDRYTMSSNIVKPQIADQLSIGYMTLTKNEMYEFSVESYYKMVKNIIDYKDGKSFNSEIEIERLILPGKGRAYGVEFYTRKNLGRLTGWIAYTLSWSENKIPGINNDKWYTAGNDRRHDISVVGMYELNNNWNISSTWVYNTGQALTAPSAKYELNGETVYHFAERNGYRSPAYHRLDVSATHTKKKKKYTREWSFGFYNLYNRYNPYIISFEDDDSKASGTKTVQTSLFGIVPSLTYTFKF